MYSTTYTDTDSRTFTVTDAKKMASKVATDLKRIQRLYNGGPSDALIQQYEAELIEFLKAGYLISVTYGYKRNGKWIEPTVEYTAQELSRLFYSNDDPGKIVPGKDISGATFWSYLEYNSKLSNLSGPERINFEKQLPFSRTTVAKPGFDGYLVNDLTYSSGGVALSRSSLRGIK